MLEQLISGIERAIGEVFDHKPEKAVLTLSPTKKEFEGDYTFVVFPLVRQLKNAPDKIAAQLGEHLKSHEPLVADFNVVKGFLNLSMSDAFWKSSMAKIQDKDYYVADARGEKMMVEFSSPNTNKPLHLGHIRNILLGWSIACIAENRGYKVIKTQIINDRGIAVCKSMMAWKRFANGETPESTGKKGDHFVGEYYVKFDQALQKEYRQWQNEAGQAVYEANKKEAQSTEDFFKAFKNQYFNEYSELGQATKRMLIDWENGDEETLALWRKMNSWVYQGFNQTYDKLGVSFDKINYESETYLLGKQSVEEGLGKSIFYRLDDGSVWIDLEDAGMDKKLVLRSDGTSVYMTQDIGTAQMRYREFGIDSMVYVVGDEQDYHFKVLFEILKRLGEPYAEKLYHLSYGMVDLPTGKMKSREGTVVDADDLVEEVIAEARQSSEARGGLTELDQSQKNEIYRKIGLAALKYFIIKVNPRKRMVFDPKESVDMQGATGPYIQNAYVRIQSILRKANKLEKTGGLTNYNYELREKELISMLLAYSEVMDEAINSYDPSVVANYAYALAKAFHRYYHDHIIYDPENPEQTTARLELADAVAVTIKNSMNSLGIEMPQYM